MRPEDDEDRGPEILEAKRHRCFRGQEFSTRLRKSVTSSGSSRGNAIRSEGRARKGWRTRDGYVDETKATAVAAVAEVVDGGGVCRDKYLPVNTERLALPSRSISVRAANDMHSRGRNV